ncbi:unnamed protein product [Candidula unifasciata]|uniref:Uncharacterized protein n=1 Tax=Candidula unifasciata TaxID=100452 RepID=A0A8S3Z9M4_9EUPU|nr:unnamed protein product [Candidula unifasciata]
MSCGSVCPCHFKWLVDTQGSKRDPINSEKAWLDFAVRLLSREVVGKARGQETVWSERCKPHWWDKAVELPWKNPTANPKDTKEVLLTKYTALERKLREEGRFPQELEEEAKLWNEGRYKELFLQTSLASLLGKVSGVHTAAIDAMEKAKELKAQVNQSLVNDLQQCLSSTLQVTNNLIVSGCEEIKPAKRSSPGSNNSNSIFEKRRKVERVILPLDKQTMCSTVPASFKPSQNINLPSKLTADEKCQTRTNSVKRYKQKTQIKPPTQTPTLQIIAPTVTTLANSLQQAVSTSGLGFSHEDINHLLLRNIIVCTKPISDATPHLTPAAVLSQTQATNAFKLSVHTNPSLISPVPVKCNLTSHKTSENTDILFSSEVSNTSNFHAISGNTPNSNTPDINFVSSSAENNSNNNGNIPVIIQDVHNTNYTAHFPLFDEDDTEISTTSSPVNNASSTSSSDRVANMGISDGSDHNISDTDYSTEHSMLECSTDHSMLEYSTENSMLDCSTEPNRLEYSAEHGVLNLDDIFSPDEQEQLWKEDGSYLLERFLEDLGGSEQTVLHNCMTEFKLKY